MGGGSTLIDAPGVNLVRAHCSSCHSERLITQNRGTRDDWERTIRWMQATQNLWPIPPDVEGSILDYLSTHYPPGRAARRPPLHPSLMPRGQTDPKMRVTTKASSTRIERVVNKPKTQMTDPVLDGCTCHSKASSRPPQSVWWMIVVVFLTAGARRHRTRRRRSSSCRG